jgi:sugar O-acyltransferase (sialic acid O-acetyltransferase NeuD family)
MKKVIVIGAGGHGAEIDDYINYAREKAGQKDLKIIGYLDDNPDAYAAYELSAPYLGGIKNHNIRHDCYYLMGIANLKYRRLFVEQFIAEGARFVSFIHPSAYVSKSASIGKGVIICPNANIGPNAAIGDFTLINARCSIGHDSQVGEYNFISPNVCFSGFTSIGDENLFGINSATIPGIKVGNKNKIAAGIVLDKNIGNDEVVFYRFKEKVIAIPKKN